MTKYITTRLRGAVTAAPQTPLAKALDRVGWTGKRLAAKLGVCQATAYRWMAAAVCPPEVLAYVEALAVAVEAVPRPTREPAKWT